GIGSGRNDVRCNVLVVLDDCRLVQNHKVDVSAGAGLFLEAASLFSAGSAVQKFNFGIETGLRNSGDTGEHIQNIGVDVGLYRTCKVQKGGGDFQISLSGGHLV